MMIIFAIPLGILSFIIAYHCFKANHAVKALWCAAFGVFLLVGAVVMGYGTMLMLQNIEPKNFDRSASSSTHTVIERDTQTVVSI